VVTLRLDLNRRTHKWRVSQQPVVQAKPLNARFCGVAVMGGLESRLADSFRWWAMGGATLDTIMVTAALVAGRRASLPARESSRVAIILLTIVFVGLSASLRAVSMILIISHSWLTE